MAPVNRGRGARPSRATSVQAVGSRGTTWPGWPWRASSRRRRSTSPPPSHAVGAHADPDRTLRLPRPRRPLPRHDARADHRGVRRRARSCAAAPSAAPSTPRAPSTYTVLAEATRVGQHPRWARVLGISDDADRRPLDGRSRTTPASGAPPRSCRLHLVEWLRRALPRPPTTPPRQQAGPLPRLRPRRAGPPAGVNGEKWEGQGKPVYGTFDRTGRATMADVVRLHLRAPRTVVAPGPRLVVGRAAARRRGGAGRARPGRGRTGPGRPHVRRPARRAARRATSPGVRLLPEFDALLCGYDSKARDRFATPEHHRRLWNECQRDAAAAAARRRPDHRLLAGGRHRAAPTARGDLVLPHPPAAQGRARRAGRRAGGGARHHGHGPDDHPRGSVSASRISSATMAIVARARTGSSVRK